MIVLSSCLKTLYFKFRILIDKKDLTFFKFLVFVFIVLLRVKR